MVAGRVAVFGGDGRALPTGTAEDARVFQSPRDGGNGELRRLEAALRGGGFARVVIVTRWNAHSATTKVRALCRRLGIPVELVRS